MYLLASTYDKVCIYQKNTKLMQQYAESKVFWLSVKWFRLEIQEIFCEIIGVKRKDQLWFFFSSTPLIEIW